MDLCAVGLHFGADRVNMSMDFHGGRARAAEEAHGFIHYRTKINQFGRVNPLTAEGQNLLHQVSGPMAGLAHLSQAFLCGMASVDILAGEIDVADDCPEDVVELVCDASCQRAQGFQLLGLAKLSLKPLAVLLGPFMGADIVDHHDLAGHVTPAVPDRVGPHFQPPRSFAAFEQQDAPVNMPGRQGSGEKYQPGGSDGIRTRDLSLDRAAC